LKDPEQFKRVSFVMKGGVIYRRNDAAVPQGGGSGVGDHL
jgi:hypothetical protein